MSFRSFCSVVKYYILSALTSVAEVVGQLICQGFGHKWAVSQHGDLKRCMRCGRGEWIYR